jgi:hypothetical protein
MHSADRSSARAAAGRAAAESIWVPGRSISLMRWRSVAAIHGADVQPRPALGVTRPCRGVRGPGGESACGGRCRKRSASRRVRDGHRGRPNAPPPGSGEARTEAERFAGAVTP